MATTDHTPTPGSLQEINDPEFLQRSVQNLLQRILNADFTRHIGAEPFQPTPNRRG